MDALSELLRISSEPLGPSSAETLWTGDRGLGAAGQELSQLLQTRNGFFAFESALHVLPAGPGGDGPSLSEWNEPPLWRHTYEGLADGLLFFAEDVFGGQFGLSAQGVASFDPETGVEEFISTSLEEWAGLVLSDFSLLTGHAQAREWQQAHGGLASGMRLLPKVPFVLGGAFDVENLMSVEAARGMRMRGRLAVQIHDLPDGSSFTFRGYSQSEEQHLW